MSTSEQTSPVESKINTEVNFSINCGKLQSALKTVGGVVEQAQVLQILAFVKMSLCKSDEGHSMLTLTTSNSEVQLVTELILEAPLEANFDITIPCKKLTDICRNISTKTNLSFHCKQDWITVSSDTATFTLSSLPSDSFPAFPEMNPTCSLSITAPELRHLITRSAFSMANQDVRYYLNGLLLEITPDKLSAIATDGHRMAINYQTSTYEVPAGQIINAIIPRKTVTELARLLESADAEVTVKLNKSLLQVCCQRFTLTSNLLESEYPNYNSLIPRSPISEAVIDTTVFRNALSRVAILANEKFHGAKLNFSQNKLRILSHNFNQEKAEEAIDIEFTADDISIAFNVIYLLDILSTISSEKIRVSLFASDRSVIIEETTTDTNSLFLVMPLNI